MIFPNSAAPSGRLAADGRGCARQCMKAIEFLADPTSGELRIGCNEPVANGLLPAVIDRLSRRYPHIIFDVILGTPDTLQSRELRERMCDLVVARLVPSVEPDMEAEVLFNEELVIVAGAQSKWAKRRKIDLDELVDEPWILTTQENKDNSPVAQAFRERGLDPPRARVLGYSQNIRNNLLLTGRFLTVVPASVLRFGVSRLLLKALPVELPGQRYPVVIITVKGRTLSPVAQLFIEGAREIAKSMSDKHGNLKAVEWNFDP